jgi:hypothetical protein
MLLSRLANMLQKSSPTSPDYSRAGRKAWCTRLAMAGGALHVLQRTAILQRSGNGGSPHRMPQITALEPNRGGIFRQDAVKWRRDAWPRRASWAKILCLCYYLQITWPSERPTVSFRCAVRLPLTRARESDCITGSLSHKRCPGHSRESQMKAPPIPQVWPSPPLPAALGK